MRATFADEKSYPFFGEAVLTFNCGSTGELLSAFSKLSGKFSNVELKIILKISKMFPTSFVLTLMWPLCMLNVPR